MPRRNARTNNPRRPRPPTRRSRRVQPARRPRRQRRARNAPVNGGWAYGNANSLTVRGATTYNTARLAGRPVSVGGPMSSLGNLCCVLADPFDPLCRGCKLPDGLNANSNVVQIHSRQALTVDSGGFGGMLITGFLPYNQISIASRSASTYTLNSTWTSVSTPGIFNSNATSYRVVCWGVRVSVTSSVPNTAGAMILSTVEAPPTTSGTWISGNLDSLEASCFSMSTGESVVWIAKPTAPRTFLGLSTTGVTPFVGSAYPWTSLFIDMYGGVASATTIDIEFIYNVEFTASQASGLSHLAPEDPKADYKSLAVVANVMRDRPSAVKGSPDSIRARLRAEVKAKMTALADDALEGAAAFLGM